MKVLYLYFNFKIKSGGTVAAKRNLDVLRQYYGADNIIEYPIERRGKVNKLRLLWEDLRNCSFGGLNSSDKKAIVDLIKRNDIKLLFLDSSLLGAVATYVKKRVDIKVITFFHNVEYDFVRMQVIYDKSYLLLYRILFAYYNERAAIKSSDVVVALNKKDSVGLKNIYGRGADYIIPITMKDVGHVNTEQNYNKPLKLLFFGSYFSANIEAVDILVREILPKTNALLIVAGSGMEQLKDKYSEVNNLTLRGFVDSLNDLYEEADVVVLPIRSGSGMKVKMAEAMMFGKNVLASDVALEGYEVDGVSGIVRCNSVRDFISNINEYDYNLPKYNNSARTLFLNQYSYEISYKLFEKIFIGII